MSRRALLALIVAASALPARAGWLTDSADADDGGADEGPPPAVVVESYAAPVVASPELKQALRDLYSLDYTSAEDSAEVFLSSHPDNPYAELFMSGELWWRTATESLKADDDPALAKRFTQHVKMAVKKAKRLFRVRSPRVQAEAYFVAGMALGLEGQWRLTNHQFFTAYLDGKKAIKYLRRSIALDPQLHDANLGLGIFDYQTAVLPAVLRLGALLLVHGDRERGLARIRDAMENGQFANQQAASFLLTIYQTQEKDYPKALELARRLRAQFPDSVYYQGVEAMLLAAEGDQPGSRAAWAGVYTSLARDPEILRRKAWGAVCGSWGESCFEPERLAAAETWTTAALAAPAGLVDPAPGWTAALHLVRGFARDARRDIKEARLDYQAVVDDPAAPIPLKSLAQSCLSQWCGAARAFSFRRL